MALSLFVHGLVVAGVAVLVSPLGRERTTVEPLELLPAPTPPPPPKMAEPTPPSPAPGPKPKPRRRKPRVVALVTDAGPTADAGPDGAPADAGAADAGAADGGVADAGADGGPG